MQRPGGVVVRCSEANHRAVGQVDGTLHEAFSEGASAHDDATIVVLNRTSHNLRGRGAKLIDHHHDAALLEEATPLRCKRLARLCAPLGVDHKVAFVEELRGNLKCRA